MKNEIINEKELRESLVSKIEVLDLVGELLLLPNNEFATVDMVASYFGVGVEAIQSLVKDNREELKINGLKVYSKSQIKNVLQGQLENFKIPNRGMNLYNKRVILNIAMLLRDSEVAKEVRNRLLDIVHDVEYNHNEIITNIVDELRTEQEISADMLEAILSGDSNRLNVLQTELIGLKNKRISQLETDNKIIINNSLTIKESRVVINRLMRKIACLKFNNSFSKAWNELYKKLNYKLNINLKARQGKPLDTMSDEEMFKTEQIVRCWAMENNIDVEKELKIN